MSAVLVSMALLAAGCGGDDDDGAGGTGDDVAIDEEAVLRVGAEIDATLTFDPTTMGAGQYVWTVPVIRPLLTRNPDGTLRPELAETAEVVDPTTVRVVLRDGLKFSDGTPVTSEAVKATFERNLASGNQSGLQIPDMQRVSEFVIDSDTEFTLKLSQPFAAVVYALLAGVEFAPMQPAQFGQGNIDHTAIGAGPMMIESHALEQRIVFKKNPHYIDADDVRLAGMEYVHVADPSAAINALRSGQIDALTGGSLLTAEQASGLSGDLTAMYRLMPTPDVMQLCIRPGQPLGDVRVRRAVNLAIDREAINEVIFGGEGQPAWDLWPEGNPWHNEDLEGVFERDVNRAKSLLAEAGYPDGFEFTLVLPVALPVHELIQGHLAEAGIRMNILASPGGGHVQDFYLQNRYEATLTQARPGPMDKISRFYLSNSFANVCKHPWPEVDAAYAELAGVDPDSDEAVELWHEIQELIVDELAIFPAIVFTTRPVAYDTDRIDEIGLYTNQLGSPTIDPVGTTIKAD